MTAVTANPIVDLLLQCVSNTDIDAIEYAVSCSDDAVGVPEHEAVSYPSRYDYFSYPVSVCTTPEALLVASCDLVVGLTSRVRSITDTGFSEISFVPDNPEETKFIYFSPDLESIFKYLLMREPLSTYMSRVSDKSLITSIGTDYEMYVQSKFSYQKVAGILDAKSYVSDTAILGLYFTTSYRDALEANTILHSDGVLVYITDNLRDKEVLEFTKQYKIVYLWNWKLVSSKTCVVCKFPRPETVSGNPARITSFVSKYLSWIASIQVPNTPIPSHPFLYLLNLP